MTHYIVIGGASHLGRALLIAICKIPDAKIWTTYHTARIDELLDDEAEVAKRAFVRRVNVRVDAELKAFLQEVSDCAESDPIRVVYCCGAFGRGLIADLDRETFQRLFEIGVIAPASIMSFLSRRRTNFMFCGVTGLPGRENAFAGGAAYAGVTAAFETIVVSAARERNPMGGYALVQIGLIDNGQKIIDELETVGGRRAPSDWSHAVSLISHLLGSDPADVNGSVLRLPHGCPSYDVLYARVNQFSESAH